GRVTVPVEAHRRLLGPGFALPPPPSEDIVRAAARGDKPRGGSRRRRDARPGAGADVAVLAAGRGAGPVVGLLDRAPRFPGPERPGAAGPRPGRRPGRQAARRGCPARPDRPPGRPRPGGPSL